jgi:hypothetical protein
VLLVPFAGSALISGSSGIGKSTLATALTERMAEKKFEFCVFDPEGDYEELDQAIPVGSVANSPTKEEVIKLLRKPGTTWWSTPRGWKSANDHPSLPSFCLRF